MASKKSKKKKKKTTITITISRAKIIQLCIFFLIAMCWSFILGVLTGRGYLDKYLKIFIKNKDTVKSIRPKDKNDKDMEPLINPGDLQFYKGIKDKNIQTTLKKQSPQRYVFQVAAFKNRKKAEEIMNKLKGFGFNAKVISKKIKNTRWYKVYVHFSGPIEKEIRLRKRLKELGLGKPVIIEK